MIKLSTFLQRSSSLFLFYVLINHERQCTNHGRDEIPFSSDSFVNTLLLMPCAWVLTGLLHVRTNTFQSTRPMFRKVSQRWGKMTLKIYWWSLVKGQGITYYIPLQILNNKVEELVPRVRETLSAFMFIRFKAPPSVSVSHI